jgi:hypothetical protein
VLQDLPDDHAYVSSLKLFDMSLFVRIYIDNPYHKPKPDRFVFGVSAVKGPYTDSVFYQLVKHFHGSHFLLGSAEKAVETQMKKCAREEDDVWNIEHHTKTFSSKAFVTFIYRINAPSNGDTDGYHIIIMTGAAMESNCTRRRCLGKLRSSINWAWIHFVAPLNIFVS